MAHLQQAKDQVSLLEKEIIYAKENSQKDQREMTRLEVLNPLSHDLIRFNERIAFVGHHRSVAAASRGF